MHLIQDQIDNIENHPEAGASLTVAHVLLAMAIKFIDNGHINPMVMEIFQLAAWCIAIVVGVFTIVGYSKRWSKPKQDDNNNHSVK